MRKIKKSTNAGLGQILEIQIFYVKEFLIAGKAQKVSLLVEVPTFKNFATPGIHLVVAL